jgi:hypothetical protein
MDKLEMLWYGGIAVVVVFVLICVGYGTPWRKGGVFPSAEQKSKARAIADRKNSSKK